MAAVKNLMVRIGADLSRYNSSFAKAAGVTGNFSKQTSAAMKEVADSMRGLKMAAIEDGKSNAGIVSLTDQIRELKDEQTALQAMGFSWGFKRFEENEAQLRSLNEQLEEYKANLATPDISSDTLAQNLRDAVSEAESLGYKLQVAKLALKELEHQGLGPGDSDWDDMYLTVNQVSDSVKEYKDSLTDAGSETESFGQKLKNAFSHFSSITKKSKSSSNGIESLVRSIRRIGLVSVGLRLTKAVFGELQSIVTQYVSQNAALQAQVTALKSSLGQALAPAINLVTNALSALMPYVVGVSNAIGSLITNLFGAGWTSVTDGANAAASAIGGAGNAQKEFNRTLAGFDEITKLGSESSAGGGGSSSATTAVEGKTPAWLTSLSDQIRKAAAEGDFFGVGAALANAINTGINSINISDTSLGSKIAGAINKGIQGATGFVETLDWSGLGDGIARNISDLVGGIDWPGVFQLLGATAGGIGTAVWSAISDGVTSTFDFFRENIEQCGGDILAGILLGIGKAIANVGSWISENIFTPFVEGFKNVFKIHSPSDHEKITSLGENIMKGIFNGITDALSDPVGWIKKNVFTPLVDGFNKVFGEDGFFANLFSGGEGGAVNISVDAEAKLTTWKDKLKNKAVDFQSKLTTWKDSLRNKVVDFQSKLTTWKDSLRNKVVDFQSNLTTFKDSLRNKVVDFQSKLTTWTDSLRNKAVDFQSNLTTWKDSLKDKSVKFQSNFTTWKDSLSNKVISFQSNLTTWKDSLQGKTLSFAANVTKGWSGTLASYLGIEMVTSQLKLDVPKVAVSWIENENVAGSGKVNIPMFTVQYNAKGGIMNAAQVFGMAGNTLFVGGEAGREAILPLDRNTWWMDKIGDRVALRVNGGQAGDQSITINLVLDGKIITSTVVRNVNAQARATGKNPLAAYM